MNLKYSSFNLFCKDKLKKQKPPKSAVDSAVKAVFVCNFTALTEY